METGKTGKNLKYAIGEIILVVIGILIALSINNWNEGKKEARQERELYVQILEDLEVEMVRVENAIPRIKEREDLHYHLFEASNGQAQYDSTMRYGLLRYVVIFNPSFKDNNQDILDQITSKTIRDAINQYFEREDGVKNTAASFNRVVENMVRPFITSNNLIRAKDVYTPERYRNFNATISVDFEASNSMVSARTDFNDNKSSWGWNWGKKNNVNMQINYTIKLPIKSNVNLNNDYGSIILDRVDGHATEHARLDGHNFVLQGHRLLNGGVEAPDRATAAHLAFARHGVRCQGILKSFRHGVTLSRLAGADANHHIELASDHLATHAHLAGGCLLQEPQAAQRSVSSKDAGLGQGDAGHPSHATDSGLELDRGGDLFAHLETAAHPTDLVALQVDAVGVIEGLRFAGLQGPFDGVLLHRFVDLLALVKVNSSACRLHANCRWACS